MGPDFRAWERSTAQWRYFEVCDRVDQVPAPDWNR
jgi:hypothetical protein